ncbi:TIGR01244 family sulfur transferase [Thalassospira sp.]|uniref:TIGR01244 family sulfur transferase n=1 Tax=Thalassospira sp. TaxID=1912094 RepID=UPI0027351266|nr:TIGR01244 family sulfur transferase [Thalassospira sp.]MDP2696710.1 TIGR01244 family sulfur transferase [Thalassospira sp.]
MTPIQITDKLFITGQISSADIAGIIARGFVAIVNNRPDDEEPGQPQQAATRAAAQAAGLGYLYLPVAGATLNAEAAGTFRAALRAASGPVLAHCRSGARSFTLWAIGEILAGEITPEQLVALANERGCDASDVLIWLAAHHTPFRCP